MMMSVIMDSAIWDRYHVPRNVFLVLKLYLQATTVDRFPLCRYSYGRPVQAIIFLSCGFFYLILSSIFFPRLFSAVADWMSTILPYVLWL